ncbi:MAG: PAS domain-containing protein [Candidatus Omnitrophica bacterium]|nr:PAS domain-containing protein [Candidatus Omnitrophota bacterium]
MNALFHTHPEILGLGFIIIFFSLVILSYLFKREHKALLVTQNHLEDLVQERTAKLEQEIIDRKKLEEILGNERKQLRDLIDSIPDYIYFKDINSKFIMANLATIRIMRCKSQEDILGKTDFDFYAKELAEKFFKDEQEILRLGKSKIDMEESVIDEYNRMRILSTSKVVLMNQDGKPVGLVGVGRDITDRKLAEEVLKRDNETLEKIIKVRSQELLDIHVELEQSKRLSDIGTLAATIAHELRNPLAAISIAAGNIKRKVVDAPIERHLQTIEKKIIESDQIINNLLFYSRLRPPQHENLYIYNVLNECVDTAREMSPKTLWVEKKIEDVKNVSIDGDPLQMKEMFMNIMNNACDAVPDARGSVEILATHDKNFINVYIKDNGVGIAKANLEKIYDPFFTTKVKGTGLGLTVCHQIIKMHGGSIRFQSEPGAGTTVIVNLPKKKK